MRLLLPAARAAAFGLVLAYSLEASVAPDSAYQQLREAAIADVLTVENIVLHRDAAVFTLKSGVIAFTAPAAGRDTVAVFLGEGEFSLTPATAIEKTYLKSLTDQESVVESFDRAVLYFTDDTGKEIRGQAKTPSNDARPADALRDFRKRHRDESIDNLEARILADLYRAGHPGFFDAYIHGRKHDNLQFHLNPRSAADSLGPEEVYLRWVRPAGIADEIWYHAHLKSEIEKGSASSDEDKRIVEAQSYKIDTRIAKNDDIAGSTTFKFRVLEGGDRLLPVSLISTLRVSKVTAEGAEIPFIQEDKKLDGALFAVFPEPLQKGATHELTFEYAGDRVVHKAGGGNFSVGAREEWYPSVNTFHDHATYDLTFRIPKRFMLVSVGKLAPEWNEQDSTCTEWVSATPIPVAGFNYGTFKKKTASEPKSGIALEGFANSELPDYMAGANDPNAAVGTISPAQLVDRTLSEARAALQVYNGYFGKSEFERIAITQQPEFNFGQSWPSLVYLPLSAYLDATQRWSLMGGISGALNEFVDEVTPHEVSHQWWGHMVGWRTYHDQWLSEGFADFSAALYLQATNKTPDRFLQYWQRARQRLLEKNNFGRRANDAGPISLGLRLSSAKNPAAYNRVVYGKGGFVLHMIRQMMFDSKQGDRYFIEAMQDFVTTYMNRNASTEDFQHVLEKHMRPQMDMNGNGKMDWFFSQWVYGTAVPKYDVSYTVTPSEGGKFLLEGTVKQSEVPPDFVMPIPIYLDFDGQVNRLGIARITGNSEVKVKVTVPKKPKRVLVNACYDVLEQ